ncbi:MAG: site-2 protease family protein, partial [Planctomycetes bacterium]|nr:site-2 protease family protein [Planctomycetota bacterium]
ELTSKTPWQRFQIFVAGAMMNLIIAFPIAILAYVVGKVEVPNEIGRPGLAEAKAGIQPGDVILEVGGRKIDSLEKLRIEMIRRPNGTIVPVKLKRGSGVMEVMVETSRSSHHDSQPPTLMLAAPVAGSPLYQKEVREKDEIVKVGDKRVFSHLEADALLKEAIDRDVTVTLRRRDPTFENDDKLREVTVKLPRKTWYLIPADENLCQARIAKVHDNTASAGILKKGDLVTQIGDKKINSWPELKAAVEVAAGVPLAITVQRDDETRTFTITPQKGEGGRGLLGVELDPKLSNIFAVVKPDSYFARMGLQTGDKLVKIADFSGDVTLEGLPKQKVPAIVAVREDAPKTIPIEVERAGQRVKLNLVAEPKDEGDLAAAGFPTHDEGWSRGALKAGGSMPFRRRPFGDAVKVGLIEPVDITVMTIDILRKVMTGGESASGFSGPIGIMQASYVFAERAFGNFVWLLCLITVNLGIFNLLPIPILDGGHNVLLLIEVVRKWFGKPPPSEKFIAGFQYVGLAFILTLFVFVTFNDITRLVK